MGRIAIAEVWCACMCVWINRCGCGCAILHGCLRFVVGVVGVELVPIPCACLVPSFAGFLGCVVNCSSGHQGQARSGGTASVGGLLGIVTDHGDFIWW